MFYIGMLILNIDLWIMLCVNFLVSWLIFLMNCTVLQFLDDFLVTSITEKSIN